MATNHRGSMHNALTTLWQQAGTAPDAGDLAERPQHRLVWLGAGFTLVLALIAARLAYIQCVLPDGLLSVFDETTELFEDIPARDGRILSADGVVLAENQERHDLWVDYRWVEEPANAEWVKHRARRHLSRSDRKQADRVAAAEASVLEHRADVWRAVAELTQIPQEELDRRRQRIQDRVERIEQRVRAQRLAAASDSSASSVEQPPNDLADNRHHLQRLWSRFWSEITTPPVRTASEPLILAEQEADHLLLEGLDAEVAAEIEAHPERYPGLRVVLSTRRTYPQEDLAAHVIGSRTPLQSEDVEEFRETLADASDVRAGDSVGRSGVERSYDAQLRGRRGLRRIVKNRRREILATEVVREPQAGRDVVLTFDTSLQRRTESLLDRLLSQPKEAASEPEIDDESTHEPLAPMIGPRGACLVALDVRTGAVLAAAAAPRFDLNLLIQADDAQWQAILNDPRRPLFPRVTQMALPPGSTFKTLSALALVEDGGLDPAARFHCQGYLDRPDKDRCLVFRHYGVGHHDTNLADALCRSCNVYFFTAARQAGPQPLVDWSRKLGFGQPTGIDIPGEGAGHLPSPTPQGTAQRRRWYPGDTLGLAIGQSSLLATPLQMARLMAAVANDGRLVTPHVVTGTGSVHHPDRSESATDFRRPEPRPIAGLHPETLSVVREGLEKVVNDRHGTAYKTVRLPNVRIAGKTGTAEVGSRLPDHAWFAGYVPAEEPRVAFVVIVEHGGSGGKVAGPVAKEFVKTLLELHVIHATSELAQE